MIKLDSADLRILSVLQRDGRITKLRLAEAVNLSPTACWERFTRLERSGIIVGFRAELDLEKLRPLAHVLVEVMLKSHRQADFHRFEEVMRGEPEIIACDATGGGVDYLLRVATRNIETYQSLIERLLAAEIGIDRYFTYVVTKTIKSGPVDITSVVFNES